MKKKHKPFTKLKSDNPGPLYLSSWSALNEYIKHKPQDILELACQERDSQRLEEIVAQHQLKCPIDSNAEELRVYIKVKIKGELELAETMTEPPPVINVLALDHITDTRNLGAIIRSAAFFGIKHIIIPRKRQASLTLGAVKTCQGALSLVDIYEVTNLSRTLKSLKEKHFWILGADMDGENLSIYAEKFERNIIVVGSEDKGLSRNVRETCDVRIAIPGAGELDSLNVSVAAGIIMQQYSKSL